MARTSRGGAPAANVDALDNIDLDDMFADEGDALFDGLDIDLDMDDIAGSGGVHLNSSPGNNNHKSTSAPLQPPAAAQGPAAEITTTRTRRKTKRKTKSPAFFEDDDEFFEEDPPPPKKKKRASTKTSSTAPQRKRGSTKKQAEPQPKKGKATKMPPPLVRGASTVPATHVAAAGQFGGRGQAKRGASFTTKASMVRTSSETSSSKVKRSQSLTAASAAAASLAEIQATHPGLMSQSNYCGLPPNNNLFYPFMPALPQEPTLKSRKIYPFVDRLHTTFTSHLASAAATDGIKPAKESDPIFQLVQEAHKEEKPAVASNDHSSNRVESVGKAIGTIRKTISNVEKPRLAADWYAVCALLQRQHDFLLQNAENMERWCKDNFSPTDYAEVYQPSKGGATNGSAAGQQLSVLGSFDTRVLKVKLLGTGLKEPNKPLIAMLPQLFSRGTETFKPAVKAKTKTTKKRKAIAAETKLAVVEPKPKQASVPVSYVNMKPARRRKAVADMLSRTARELEINNVARVDVRQRALDREESDLRKLVQDDKVPAIHTAGMWRWLEKSAYFSNISETGIRQFKNDVESPAMARTALENRDDQQTVASGAQCSNGENDSLLDRLQSLLVEEEDTGDDASVVEEDLGDFNFGEMYIESETADLSELTADERSFIHLQRLGLAESLTPPIPKRPASMDVPLALSQPKKKPNGAMTALIPKGTAASQQEVKPSPLVNVALGPQVKPEYAAPIQNGVANSTSTVSSQEDKEGDLESVIDSMKNGLIQADEINCRRASFLESVVRSCHQTSEEVKRKKEQEASLIAKCHQLLRKSKEMKAKTESVKKDNSLALPW